MRIEEFHPKRLLEAEVAWQATRIGFHFVRHGVREGTHILKEGKITTLVTGSELIAKAQEHMGATHSIHEIFSRYNATPEEEIDYSDYAGDSQFDPKISFFPVH